MKRKGSLLFGLVAISLIATTVHAQEPTSTPTPGLAPVTVAAGFGQLSFWVALLAALIAGAAGGVVYELLILQGNIELPHRLTDDEIPEAGYTHAIGKYMYDLGIWARVIIGGVAAVAAFLVIAPGSAFELLGAAVVAGSAGTSVFRSIQDRLLATMAQRDAANTRATAVKMNAKVEEASRAFADLKEKLVKVSTSPVGERRLDFEAGVGLDLEDVDKVERLLSEAKGIHEGI